VRDTERLIEQAHRAARLDTDYFFLSIDCKSFNLSCNRVQPNISAQRVDFAE
jgi:hypothetical protein